MIVYFWGARALRSVLNKLPTSTRLQTTFDKSKRSIGPDSNPHPLINTASKDETFRMEESRGIDGVKIPSCSKSPLISRVGLLGLIPVLRHWMADSKEISFEWGYNCRIECLFYGIRLLWNIKSFINLLLFILQRLFKSPSY